MEILDRTYTSLRECVQAKFIVFADEIKKRAPAVFPCEEIWLFNGIVVMIFGLDLEESTGHILTRIWRVGSAATAQPWEYFTVLFVGNDRPNRIRINRGEFSMESLHGVCFADLLHRGNHLVHHKG